MINLVVFVSCSGLFGETNKIEMCWKSGHTDSISAGKPLKSSPREPQTSLLFLNVLQSIL